MKLLKSLVLLASLVLFLTSSARAQEELDWLGPAFDALANVAETMILFDVFSPASSQATIVTQERTNAEESPLAPLMKVLDAQTKGIGLGSAPEKKRLSNITMPRVSQIVIESLEKMSSPNSKTLAHSMSGEGKEVLGKLREIKDKLTGDLAASMAGAPEQKFAELYSSLKLARWMLSKIEVSNPEFAQALYEQSLRAEGAALSVLRDLKARDLLAVEGEADQARPESGRQRDVRLVQAKLYFWQLQARIYRDLKIRLLSEKASASWARVTESLKRTKEALKAITDSVFVRLKSDRDKLVQIVGSRLPKRNGAKQCVRLFAE